MLELDPETGYLVAGLHRATLHEIEVQFASNYKRRTIFKGLTFAVEGLRMKLVETIWVDGSFVTAKERPGDVDVIYVPPDGAVPETWGLLAPSRRKELKKHQHVDLWPYPSYQPSRSGLGRLTILEFFLADLDDREKGAIELIL